VFRDFLVHTYVSYSSNSFETLLSEQKGDKISSERGSESGQKKTFCHFLTEFRVLNDGKRTINQHKV